MNHGKIVGVGWNYPSHAKELGGAPEEPVIFLKPSSCLIGDGDDIVIPEGVTNVQHEVELAVIIGYRVKRVPAEYALTTVSHVAVFNDVTARDMQGEARRTGGPWDLCKGMDTFGPMSEPVPLVQAGDLQSIELTLTVNGEVRQLGNTCQMAFTVPQVISYVSRYMTLEPGDIVITGTPPGVSELHRGDVVTASASKVGTVTNNVV